MWGFGENNLYENMAIDSPTIRRWQQRIQRALTFAPLLVAGAGGRGGGLGGVIRLRREVDGEGLGLVTWRGRASLYALTSRSSSRSLALADPQP